MRNSKMNEAIKQALKPAFDLIADGIDTIAADRDRIKGERDDLKAKLAEAEASLDCAHTEIESDRDKIKDLEKINSNLADKILELGGSISAEIS